MLSSFLVRGLLERTSRNDLRNFEFWPSTLFNEVYTSDVVVVLLSELNEVVVWNVVGVLKPSQVIKPADRSVSAIFPLVALNKTVVTVVRHISVLNSHSIPFDG